MKKSYSAVSFHGLMWRQFTWTCAIFFIAAPPDSKTFTMPWTYRNSTTDIVHVKDTLKNQASLFDHLKPYEI